MKFSVLWVAVVCVAAVVMPRSATAGIVLFADNFNGAARGGVLAVQRPLINTSALGTRLSGSLAGTINDGSAYVAGGNSQIGNSTLDPDAILFASGGTLSVDYNFNGADAAGGLDIGFDVRPNNANNSNWLAFNLGNPTSGIPNVGAPANNFGILFRGNGGFQVFEEGSLQAAGTFFTGPGNASDGFSDILVQARGVGDDNPFDGVGETTLDFFANGASTPFYSFAKADGYTDNFISFRKNGNLGAIDNLSVTAVPEPSSMALLGLAAIGAAAHRRRRRR